MSEKKIRFPLQMLSTACLVLRQAVFLTEAEEGSENDVGD